MKSVSEFLYMGGYAAYVWGAYGICAAIMIWTVVDARKEFRVTSQRIKQRLLQKEHLQ